MAETVSDFVIERCVGGGSPGSLGSPATARRVRRAARAAQRAGEGLDYIRPTHEEICALMATAHAKFTGEVGVCVATSSPGAFHC